MASRNLRKISVILIACFVFQFVFPAVSSGKDDLSTLQKKCNAAYVDYSTTISSGANLDVVQNKLEIYLQTYKDYQNALTGKKGQVQQPAGGAAAPALEFPKDAGPAAQESSPGNAGEIAAAASGDSQSNSWFSKAFNKVKDVVVGKSDKKDMPLWEKILWKIGKAIVPTFGVMAAAALLAPLSPIMMIVGGIAVGASLGGLLTYAYEKRMNAKYRETPKEDAKIWRDVTVTGAVEAVMAPFNLATGGLFGMVGPTVGSAIGKVALTQAAITFTGSALSARVGGMVKHLWAKNYFHYPEKIAANQERIDKILESHLAAGTPLSDEEWKELDKLRAEIDMMKSEDYTSEDFTKDLKRAAVSSVISGFASSVVADRFYTYDKGKWADQISIKVFGSSAQGKQISALVSTLPVNYIGGVAGASLEKSFINQDVVKLRNEQLQYPASSAGYEYYDRLIKSVEARRESINSYQAGLNSMLDNLAVRSAQLGVQALKYNLYDAPKAKKQAVEAGYRQQSPEWKKAAELYEKYQETLKKGPDPKNYKTTVSYARAQAAHLLEIKSARQEWLKQCSVAQDYGNRPDQQIVRDEITAKYEKDVRLNQILELGRLKGGMAHINAMKKVIQEQNPDQVFTDKELSTLAVKAVIKSYTDKQVSTTTKVDEMEKLMSDYEDYKAGKLQLSPAQAKILEGQKSLLSPSQYKAALVEKRVYDLKTSNTSWAEIRQRMPEILGTAEKQTLNKYGGNWGTVLVAEMYANGLARYKYNPDGSTNFKEQFSTMVKSIPAMIESGVVTDYKTRINDAIVSNVIPNSNQENQFERYMGTFAKTAISQSSNTVVDSVYKSSKEAIFRGF